MPHIEPTADIWRALPFGLLSAGWAVHVRFLRRRLKAARRDPLSGLLTRAGWIRRTRRIITKRNAAVALIDLDGFKIINDSFGHAAGDTIIAATGQRLASWCDRDAVAGRLGGDEFVIAARDHDGGLDARLAELEKLLSEPVEHGGQLLPVGASMGVARLADLDEPTLTGALSAADQAMYRAKGRGRRGRGLVRPTLVVPTL